MKKTLISIHVFIEFQNTKDIEKILKAEERGKAIFPNNENESIITGHLTLQILESCCQISEGKDVLGSLSKILFSAKLIINSEAMKDVFRHKGQ